MTKTHHEAALYGQGIPQLKVTLKVSHQAWEDAELWMFLRKTAGRHLSQEQDGMSHMPLPWVLVLPSPLKCNSQPEV